MANGRSIGRRPIQPRRVMSKLTVEDIAELRRQGRQVVELPGGQVSVDGAVFQVIGRRRAAHSVSNVPGVSVIAEGDRVHAPRPGRFQRALGRSLRRLV